MEDWREYKIGDICKIKRGASPRPIQKYISNNGMPWVKIADATASDSMFLDSTKEYIIEEGVSKSVTVLPGTLIVSNSATPGLPKIIRIKACVHDGWLVISDFQYVLRDFMYYKFVDIRRYLSNQANGSVFQNLKTDIVRDFTIKIPSIKTQKEIVSLLKSLDVKIEINRRINENLEQQAQALFKSWFVDFEPFKDGEFIESELGMIPKGWRVVELQDIVTIKRGGSPRPIQAFLSLSGYHWLKISDATACQSPYIFEIKEFIKESGLSKTVKLGAGSLVLSNSATPGIPKILGIDSCIHDGWLYFPQSHLSKYYLYMLFKEKRDFLLSQGNGSVFTNLKTDIVKAMKIAIPNNQIMAKFNTVIESLFNQIENKTKESRRLATLRETLLPRLMSGEIQID